MNELYNLIEGLIAGHLFAGTIIAVFWVASWFETKDDEIY